MRHFLHLPKFFIDRVQIIFALLLLCVIFAIAFLSLHSPVPVSPKVTPTRSETQAPQEVTPTGQNDSLNPLAKKAIVLVNNLKAVQDAKNTAAEGNTKFVTEVDSYPTVQNNFYIIHAYEIVQDGNGHAHTATVGWYQVNPQTGTVTNTNNSPPN